MLNQRPIILSCFSRGGSNIFWNLFLTHPDVCSPIRETLEIFRLDLRDPHLEGYLAVLLSRQPRLFDQWRLAERPPLPRVAQRYVDRTLFRWKLKTLTDGEMRYKHEGETYTEEEVRAARLTVKNNNGLAFLTGPLHEMYPDATFFGLVRHPVALYESHLRRKTPPARTLETFAAFYRAMVEKMLADQDRFPSYHLFRFEDLLQEPLQSLTRAYALAGLDPGAVRKVRFKAKAHLQANGRHATTFTENRHYWFEPQDMHRILEPSINELQAGRVDAREQERLLEATRAVCERVGYLAGAHGA
jgi:hypothetical protein